MPDDVIIFGGHGKVALHLSRILSDRGYQVSAVFRNPDHTDEVAGTGPGPLSAISRPSVPIGSRP